MAAALSLTFGRGGALLGNLLFGFLIDLNCVVPIVLFSAMLLSKYETLFNVAHSFEYYPFIVFVAFHFQLVVSCVSYCRIQVDKPWTRITKC